MSAKIIAKNHKVNVVEFIVNGQRRRYVEVEKTRDNTGKNDMIVFAAIAKVGFKWESVYTYLFDYYDGNMTPALEKAINKHTI